MYALLSQSIFQPDLKDVVFVGHRGHDELLSGWGPALERQLRADGLLPRPGSALGRLVKDVDSGGVALIEHKKVAPVHVRRG